VETAETIIAATAPELSKPPAAAKLKAAAAKP